MAIVHFVAPYGVRCRLNEITQCRPDTCNYNVSKALAQRFGGERLAHFGTWESRKKTNPSQNSSVQSERLEVSSLMGEEAMINLVLFLLLFGAARQARTSPGVVVTSAEMNDTLQNAKPNPGSVPGTVDVTVRSVDVGSANVGVAVVKRLTAETNDAILHEKVTEIYYMTEGSGTLELGGTLVDPKPFGTATGVPAIGPSERGTGIRGGTSRRVNVGDVVVIPAGTPHRFSAIDGPITYINYRVDPGKVTPLK